MTAGERWRGIVFKRKKNLNIRVYYDIVLLRDKFFPVWIKILIMKYDTLYFRYITFD